MSDQAQAMPTTATISNSEYDVLITNGRIVDGSGNPWVSGDIAIRDDRIAAIGNLDSAHAKRVVDATGLVVSPGFIDMLGQSEFPLLIDNRSLSKLSQGITTEITGEGGSIAPQTDKTIAAMEPMLDHYKLTVDWKTLDGYFQRLEKSGTPLNIGTYVGAGQIREAIIGDVDRAPTPEELEQMKGLVAASHERRRLRHLHRAHLSARPLRQNRRAHRTRQSRVAIRRHLRLAHAQRRPDRTCRPLRKLFASAVKGISRSKFSTSRFPARSRWGNMTKVVAQIQTARDAGQDVTADMYPYIAGGTALASSLPPWVADGGMDKLLERLKDPATRSKIKIEMAADHPTWENLYFDSGGGAGVLVSGVENPELKQFDGKTIEQIAVAEKKSQLDALFDFVIADKGQTGALYFMANENDLQSGLKQTWTSLCLDASEASLDGPLFEEHAHPRQWGAMPRFVGHYVRDQHLLPLEQGIRKMTSLPAQRERLIDRGLLKVGYFADITVFDPATIIDIATYTQPAQMSKGVKYVFVNGQLEFEDGS